MACALHTEVSSNAPPPQGPRPYTPPYAKNRHETITIRCNHHLGVSAISRLASEPSHVFARQPPSATVRHSRPRGERLPPMKRRADSVETRRASHAAARARKPVDEKHVGIAGCRTRRSAANPLIAHPRGARAARRPADAYGQRRGQARRATRAFRSHARPRGGSPNPPMGELTHLVAHGHRRPRSTRWVNVRQRGRGRGLTGCPAARAAARAAERAPYSPPLRRRMRLRVRGARSAGAEPAEPEAPSAD